MFNEAIAQPSEITKQHFDKISTLETIPEPKLVTEPIEVQNSCERGQKDLTGIKAQVQGIAKE